jgi:hypothetical protein
LLGDIQSHYWLYHQLFGLEQQQCRLGYPMMKPPLPAWGYAALIALAAALLWVNL